MFCRRLLLSRASVGAAAGAALGLATSAARCEPPPPPPPAAATAATAPPPAASSFSLLGPIQSAYDSVYGTVYDNVVKPFAEPSREKLLPDVPPQIKGTVNDNPTLVVSLDGCLIESVWTRQHGWRYIKRPGVDQFLISLAPFYELVLWT